MPIPNATAIKALLEVASGSIEAIQYAVSRAIGKLTPALMEGLLICQKRTEMALEHSSEAAWQGKYVAKSRVENLMENQMEEAAQSVGDNLKKGVYLDIAINDNAEYMYRYLTQDNESLTPEQQREMDRFFKEGWLFLENNIVVIDGIMYQASKDALREPLKDAKGNNQRVDVDALKTLLVDPEKGFAAWIREKKQYNVDVQQVDYPKTTPTA